MRKPISIAALALSSFAAGCSSSVADPAPDGPTAEQACTDLSNLYCSKVDGCAHVFTEVAFGDLASCKANFKSQCLLQLAAPSTGSTAQKQADCVTAATSLTCADFFLQKIPAACLPVAGKLADGAACGDDSQCTSKYCSTGDGAVCGKCGTAPAAGASCSTQHCGPGLDCKKDDDDKTGKTRTCIVPGDTGATCSKTAPCRQDLSCTDGKCGPAAANVGDTCNFNGVGGPQCDITKGLLCLPTTSKCIAFKMAGGGAACGYDATAGTYTGCTNQGVCKTAKAGDSMGTCVAAVGVGIACNDDETVGPKCLAPLKCVSGKCVTPDPAACK